ncbi:disease resistance protein [Senna tora]|uniref:Disease resistance protein n=1 Tax=Senna tora TaxID=362788 RepID=A0A835C689_9FABA|nr:disease resistance protein [Senna tora]
MVEVGESIASKLAEYLIEATIQQGRYLFCGAKVKRNFKSEKEKLLATQESVQKRVQEARRRTDEIDDAVRRWLDDVNSLIKDMDDLEQDIKENKSCFGGSSANWPSYCLSKKMAKKIERMHACINEVKSQEVAREVAKECKGLPIALVAMGSCIKKKDLDDIKAVLHKLRHSKPIDDIDEGDEKGVFGCLRLSYNYLKNKESKLLFLMCSVFPEDHKINPEDLFRYGIGLNVYSQVDSFEMARSCVNAAINILIESSLLMRENDINGDAFYMMHDMVRDVALFIASEEDRTIVVNHSTRQNSPLEDGAIKDCFALSCWKMDRNLPHQLDAPRLEMLLINIEAWHLNYGISLPSFEGFKGMKVVAIMNNILLFRTKPALILSHSTHLLTNLRTMRLVGMKLDDISFVVSLRNLEILDFQESANIKDLLRRAIKVGLKMLKGGCKNVIPELVQAVGGMNELIGLYLESCSEIECVFNTTSLMASSFDVSTVVQSLLLIQELQIVECHELKHIMTSGVYDNNRGKQIVAVPDNFYLCFSRLKKLHIRRCHKLEYIFPISVVQRLEQLEEIRISNAPDVKYLFSEPDHEYHSSSQNDIQIVLPRLKVVSLLDLLNLVKIFPESYQYQLSWPFLTEFYCEDCPKLKIGWAGSKYNQVNLEQRQSFLNKSKLNTIQADLQAILNVNEEEAGALMIVSNLEKLYLKHLDEVEYIWKGPTLINFQLLTYLGVEGCRKLRCIFSSAVIRSLPLLNKLSIINCEELEQIISLSEEEEEANFPNASSTSHPQQPCFPMVEYICNGPTLISFQHLEELRVEGCRKLRCIFSSAVIKSLPLLYKLFIINCEELEEIISLSEEEANFPNASSTSDHLQHPSFPKLDYLKIEGCNRLKCVFPLSISLYHLPSLSELIIRRCCEIDQVFCCAPQNHHHTQLPHLHNLNLEDLPFQLPRLEGLTLEELPNLTNFCRDFESHLKLEALRWCDVEDCPNFSPTTIPALLKFITHTVEGGEDEDIDLIGFLDNEDA